MNIKFKNYKCGYRVVSFASDDCVKNDLAENQLDVIKITDGHIVLYPDNIILSEDKSDIEKLEEFSDYDVFEIWENGNLRLVYNDKSNDNYFFITGACNSNCIMCPSSDYSRRTAGAVNINDLIKIAEHIPSDTGHLTITGGEPFLAGEQIFTFIRFLKEKFEYTEFLFLTNGRIFSVEKYLELLIENIPDNSLFAIPVHGSCSMVHDSITRAEGSFLQTRQAIKNLLADKIKVELRLVVNKMNIDDFNNIADLIINEFSTVQYVSIIAMEMTGNARVNREKVWIPYKESLIKIDPAIRKLIINGINVKLYNFPVCTVPESLRTLCEKSISAGKIKFNDSCSQCKYKPACGGVFAGTYNLEKDEMKAEI